MQSYTVTALITAEPQTSSVAETTENGATDIEPDGDEFTGRTDGNTAESAAYTITQSNGNTVYATTYAATASFTSAWANPLDPENDSGETINGFQSYASYATNGAVFTGTNFGALQQVGTLVTRPATRVTGTSEVTFAASISGTTQVTSNRQILTTSEQDGAVAFVTTLQPQSVTTTTQKTGQSESTNILTGVVEESGYSFGPGDSRWPTYATATVLMLDRNELAWVVTTNSDVACPIESIATSYVSRATVLPRYFTFAKDQSNLYETQSGFVTTVTDSGNATFSAFSSQATGTVAVANTTTGRIPFPTAAAASITIATSQGTATWEYTDAIGGTKGLKTTTGIRSKGITRSVTNGTTVENTYNVISTIPDEASVILTANTVITDSGETIIPGAVTRTIESTGNTTEVIEYTGHNTQDIGFAEINSFPAIAAERSFYSAAAAHNGGIGSNLDIPAELTGIPSMARLAIIAATPYPTSYTASVGGQAATISIGENVTVSNSASSTSYDIAVVGDALKTAGGKAPIRGGNSPDGQTLAIGPGRYEAHYASGGSTTTSYTERVILTLPATSSPAATVYRPIREYIAVGGARYVVTTFATTATNPFV
jgi:hypothetical protein